MKFITCFIVFIAFFWNASNAQSTSFDDSGETLNRDTDNQNQQDLYFLYPNPSNGSVQLTILSAKVKQFKLKIYDIHGGVVFDKFFKGAFKGLNLDLKLKKSGLYFLIIESGNHQYVEKVMIEP